jgi:hypothetical protein
MHDGIGLEGSRVAEDGAHIVVVGDADGRHHERILRQGIAKGQQLSDFRLRPATAHRQYAAMDVKAGNGVHHLLRGNIDRHVGRRRLRAFPASPPSRFSSTSTESALNRPEENSTLSTTLPSAMKASWRPARSRSRIDR